MARFFGVPMRNGVALGVASTLPMRGGLPVPALNLDFLSGALDSRITFTRGSTATFFDSTGTLQSAAINAARFDHNPATLAPLGLLIEEQRTNSIRNNTMQGAVAGTPGTLPTNWTVSGLGTLTQQVVGVGTVNGINYIDLRFSGTTSTTQVSVRFEPANGAAGTNGQTFSFSSWVARVAGSTSNIGDISANANIYDAGAAFLTSLPFSGYPVTVSTTLTRLSGTGTIASATAAFIQPQIYVNFASGVAIDITLRIGLPQLEQGAFATSVIPTTTTALTRNADVASMTGTNFSSWFNAAAGTIVCQFRKDVGTTARLIVVDNGSGALTTNGINLDLVSATQARTEGFAGGALQWDLRQTIALNSTQTTAVAYATNDIGFSANGASPTTDSVATIASTGISVMALANWQGASQLNGWLRRVSYYPRRLPDSTLQALTA